MARRKFYVVFNGYQPGIYDNWDDCEAQVNGFKGASYKSYDSCEEATNAFRQRMDVEEMQFYTFLTQHKADRPDYSMFPEIKLNAIAVDAACNDTHGGNVEYQGVIVGTGQQVFHFGPLDGGSNNIGEYLALVHALALLSQSGDGVTPIYTDSRTAISWVYRRRHNSTIQMSPESKVAQLLARADRWLATHTWTNPVYKWETSKWGEIPADFGRK